MGLQIYPMKLGDKFKFGTHKGESLHTVIDDNCSYVEWCIENVSGFELDNEAWEMFNFRDFTSDADIY